jgi:hypothetical protein
MTLSPRHHLRQGVRLRSRLPALAAITPRDIKPILQDDEVLEPKHRHIHSGVRSSSKGIRSKTTVHGSSLTL